MANPKISIILLHVETLNDPKVLSVANGEVFIVSTTNTMYWRNAFTGIIAPLSASGDSSNIAEILQNSKDILQNQKDIKDKLQQLNDTIVNESKATRDHVTNKTDTVVSNQNQQFTAVNQHLNQQDVKLDKIVSAATK